MDATTILETMVEVRQRRYDRCLKLLPREAISEDEADACYLELLQSQLELARYLEDSP